LSSLLDFVRGAMVQNNHTIKISLLLLLLLSFLLACRSEEASDMEVVEIQSPIATSQAAGVLVVEPQSPLNGPTPTPFVAPTPGVGVSTVYGRLVDSVTGAPSMNIPIYLGEFDGTLMEISVNNSPQVFTDQAGYFVFTDVPANDGSSRYTLGIILTNIGVILKEPDSEAEIVFDAVAGEVIDLGVLKNSLR